MKENSGLKLNRQNAEKDFHHLIQLSAFLVVLGSMRPANGSELESMSEFNDFNLHMSPPPASRTATMNVGAGQYVSRSVAMTTKR